MAGWGLIIFIALGVAVSANQDVTFPEIARERSPSRIVSGWEAEEGQFPFQLSLRMIAATGTVSACGGSIIHPQWGLTAAHCTAGRVSFMVRAGAVNMTRPYMIFEVTEYYNHPLYNNELQSVVQPHDISVIKFPLELSFNDRAQPIRMHSSTDKDRNYNGVRLTASGWGNTWTSGSSPENLNWVYLTGVSNQQCSALYGGSSIIVDSTICTMGYNDTTQSTCQGDSGGPLTVVDYDGEVSQVGIASFVSGQGCHADVPAGFIRPGHYYDWFYDVTGIDFDWTPEHPETDPEAPESPVTVDPEVTDAPEHPVTVEPEVTDAPEHPVTVDPEVTDAPEHPVTVDPEATDAPEHPVTVDPEVTNAPEHPITVDPEVTEAPETPVTVRQMVL